MQARIRSLPLFSAAVLGIALAGTVAPSRAAFAADAAASERCGAQDQRKFVGFVVAFTGSGFIENPDCDTDKRPLACGDLLFEHDQISTGPGGHAAFLAKNVYSQMDAGSEIRLGLTEAGGPDISVLRGHVRITDQRKDATDAPHRIGTPFSQTLGSGSDTEVNVTSDPQSASASLCEMAKPLDVTSAAGGTGIAVPVGQCAVAGPQAPLHTGPAPDQKIVLAPIQQCDLVDVGDQFNPNDVAANGEIAFLPPPDSLLPIPPFVTPAGPPSVTPVGPPVTPPTGVKESAPGFRPPPGLGRP